MAKLQFGHTWWGRQWLSSLEKISFENRLPRGLSYARKGAVTHIETKENKIIARVKGSAPRPYNIFIQLLPFTKMEQDEIAAEISSDPLLLSKLLNKIPASLTKPKNPNSPN